MKIKLLTSRVGVNGAQNRGDVIDVPADEGQRMVDAGQAVIVRAVKPETAIKKRGAEKAIK